MQFIRLFITKEKLYIAGFSVSIEVRIMPHIKREIRQHVRLWGERGTACQFSSKGRVGVGWGTWHASNSAEQHCSSLSAEMLLGEVIN